MARTKSKLHMGRVAVVVAGIVLCGLIVGACAPAFYQWPSLQQLSNQEEINLFNRRVAIEVDNSAAPGGHPSENLVDVPVAVFLDATKIASGPLAAEPAVRFYDKDLNLLAHEVEQWDPDGDSLVWVKVPSLPKDGSTTIYLYYDYRGDELTPSPADVFSNNYAGVWHLAETSPGFYKDSSGNGNHGSLSDGTASFQAPSSTTGKLGRAANFTADNMGIAIPALSANDITEITISMWVAVRDWTSTGRFIFRPNFDVYMTDQDEKMQIEFGASATNIVITATEMVKSNLGDPPWGFYTFLWNGTLPPFGPYHTWGPYTNGVPFAGGSVLLNGGSGTVKGDAGLPSVIGNVNWTATPQRAPDAIIDEVRISTVVRSAHWNYIQYKSMSDTLLTFGAEEEL
ncbi:MAG: DUF2341 domain-containing protein [Spirochaetota bacterium]